MKPGARLGALIGAAALGAGLATLGASATWYRTIERSQRIDSSLGSISVRGTIRSFSAGALGSPIPAIALLCLVFALLAFLVGPRARAGLMVAAALESASVAILVFVVPMPELHAGAVLQRGPGLPVTFAGGLIALAGSATAIPLARRVRRIRMPETGPDEALRADA